MGPRNRYPTSVNCALWMLKHHATVRQVANHFGLPRMTIYNRLTKYLLIDSPTLFDEITTLLGNNKADMRRRGGIASQKKRKLNKKASESKLKSVTINKEIEYI